MKKQRSLLILLALLVITALGACKPTPMTSTPSTPEVLTPYFITGIPTPDAPDKCTITGVLMLMPGPQPAKRALLALAEVLENNGTPAASRLSSQNSPRALTDDNGHFLFLNVPAGKTYTLILDKITSSFMLTNPTSGDDMLIACKAVQVIDLGDLTYSMLPLTTPEK